MKQFRFIDLFCGGGGSITGCIDALNAAGLSYEGRGYNHWPIAIKTIQYNHPEVIPNFARACTSIESVIPDEVFAKDPQRIDAIWASPSCTHHSVAAGGKPRSNQLRSQPECILPFIRLTKCRRLYVENVKELRSWGPLLDQDTRIKGKLYRAGMPDPRKAGKFFDLWLREIKESGYSVDMQIMNSADYGAATSRERLIIQAVRRSAGEKIIWPEPTHSKYKTLFDYKPWRSAAEIIDWSIPGESIFDRKRPLCENTLRRIEAGIEKYWGEWAEPFLIVLRGTKEKQLESSAIPLSHPLPTITAEGGHIALISPFLTRYNGGENRNHDINAPLPVIDTGNRYSVIQPIWLDLAHTKNNGVDGRADEPLNTITCSHGTHAVIEPLFIPQNGGGVVKSCLNPLSTIATRGCIGIVEPFLVDYHGTGSAQDLKKPLNTIRTHDRFGLVEGRILHLPDGRKYKLDITHRMLTAKELAAATGFPDGYRFAGGDTAAKKQIGNAVCPCITSALYRAFLAA